MTKVQKIREYLVGMAGAACCDAKTKKVIKENILPFIDTMQEEPISDDLENAAEDYCKSTLVGSYYIKKNAFKAGMKKMKEQMMAKAIDGYVIEDIEEGNGDFLLSADYLPKSIGLKDQQRVKVIVIKED